MLILTCILDILFALWLSRFTRHDSAFNVHWSLIYDPSRYPNLSHFCFCIILFVLLIDIDIIMTVNNNFIIISI